MAYVYALCKSVKRIRTSRSWHIRELSVLSACESYLKMLYEIIKLLMNREIIQEMKKNEQ